MATEADYVLVSPTIRGRLDPSPSESVGNEEDSKASRIANSALGKLRAAKSAVRRRLTSITSKREVREELTPPEIVSLKNLIIKKHSHLLNIPLLHYALYGYIKDGVRFSSRQTPSFYKERYDAICRALFSDPSASKNINLIRRSIQELARKYNVTEDTILVVIQTDANFLRSDPNSMLSLDGPLSEMVVQIDGDEEVKGNSSIFWFQVLPFVPELDQVCSEYESRKAKIEENMLLLESSGLYSDREIATMYSTSLEQLEEKVEDAFNRTFGRSCGGEVDFAREIERSVH